MAASIRIDHRHAAAERPRLALLDAARGGALVLMFVYHFIWDLDFFGLIDPQVARSPAFAAFSHLIAGAFLFISGYSLLLAHRRRFRLDAFARHVGVIVLAATLVTAATAWIMPQGMVTFGILHCLAAGALVSAPFLRAPFFVTLAVAAAMIAAPFLWSSGALNAPSVNWIGLGTVEPATLDWRPLLPWAGFVTAGLGVAQAVAKMQAEAPLWRWRADGKTGRGLILMGRWSLPIYLVHQPVFLAILWLAAQAVGPASVDAQLQAFVGSCTAQCRTTGADATVCSRNCLCLADGLKAEGLWSEALAKGFDESSREAARRIGEACARR